MNWECSVLNRIYRTKLFKFNVPSFTKLNGKVQNETINKINNWLIKFELDKENLHVNTDCALYYLYSGTNKTFYYSINTNIMFYIYVNIFNLSEKVVILNDRKEDIQYWQKYLLKLLFIKERSQTDFKSEIINTLNGQHFNHEHHQEKFILGNLFSYIDVVLYSIMFNYNFSFLKNQAELFIKWYNEAKNEIALDENRIIAYMSNKYKENLYETYKLTSHQPLVNAVLNKNYVQIEKLLSLHYNVNSRKEITYKTLIHLACSTADVESFKILMKYNCDLEAFDFENMTPLYDAIYSGNILFVDNLLTNYNLNINHREIQNRTPFYWASCTGNIPMIKYLLTKNIDINATSSMGRTPLSKACWNGREDTVKLLCSQPNIKVNIPDKNGRFPLHNAVWGEYGGRQGKKMNGGESSDSPLCVLELIKAGAEINVKDNEGDTPFMIAASTNGLESLKILIKYQNINVNDVNNKGETAITQATQYGNWESVGVLLQFDKDNITNIDLNIKDNEGYTAIEHAIIYQRVICFKILFEYGKFYNYFERLSSLCVMCNSILCFEYLVNVVGDKIEIPLLKHIVKDLIIRCFVLKTVECFVILWEALSEVVTELFIENNDMELFVYACIVREDLLKKCNERKIGDAKQNKKFKEKNAIYNQIIQMKMSDITKEMKDLIDRDFENYKSDNDYQIINKFDDIIKTLLLKLASSYKNNHNNILNSNYLKLLIHFSFLDNFLEIDFQKQCKLSSISEIPHPVKDLFIRIKASKHSNEKVNIFLLSNFSEQIDDYNSNNVLTSSIKNNNPDFFNKLISNKEILNLIFYKTPITNRNILHSLFDINSNKSCKYKFKSIIKILENNWTEFLYIQKFISFINESDIYSLTPLDLLLRSYNSNYLEEFTNELNILENKYKMFNTHQTMKYKVLHFDILSSSTNLDYNYKSHLISRLKQCQSINNSKDPISLNLTYEISQYKITQDMQDTIVSITNLITNGNIQKEFLIEDKDYSYKYISTEQELKELHEELLNQKNNIIGIDAEFDGNNCDIDGIVCLIQISTFSCSYVIDTLQLHKYINQYLKPILESNSILKIFHGCDSDIFWLLSNFNIFTQNIYDTARSFQVFQNVILHKTFKQENLPSLYYLIKFFLNVKLDKSYQKSNWKIRPFTKSMLQYAVNDSKSVLYLFYILQGLFLYLNGKYPNYDANEKHKQFYADIQKKFCENKVDINQIQADISNKEETKRILVKIAYKCLEMVSTKYKETYIKHDISLHKITK